MMDSDVPPVLVALAAPPDGPDAAVAATELATVRQHAALRRLIRHLVDGAELETVLGRACLDLAETLAVARVAVCVIDDDGAHLRCVTRAERATGEVSSGGTVPIAALPAYLTALRDERTIATADAAGDPRTREWAAHFRDHAVTSALHATCRHGDDLLGVVGLEHVGPPRAWTADEIAFVASVADTITLAIEGHRRRHAERVRAELEANLRQAHKMESLGLLAGGVAHALNNLLTPILMGTEMVKATLARDAGPTDLVDSIVSAAVDARELVGQLLAFSRKQVLELRELDASDEVRRAVKLLRRTLPETIAIDVALTPDLAVRADAPQLQQVLLNLAINARDAMPAGGTLRLSTFAHDAGGTAMVGVAVEDTGAGMDADTLSHIFEPFFTTKGLGRGTGLGLSTVYGIVQQHGGTIHVASTPGRGRGPWW